MAAFCEFISTTTSAPVDLPRCVARCTLRATTRPFLWLTFFFLPLFLSFLIVCNRERRIRRKRKKDAAIKTEKGTERGVDEGCNFDVFKLRNRQRQRLFLLLLLLLLWFFMLLLSFFYFAVGRFQLVTTVAQYRRRKLIKKKTEYSLFLARKTAAACFPVCMSNHLLLLGSSFSLLFEWGLTTERERERVPGNVFCAVLCHYYVVFDYSSVGSPRCASSSSSSPAVVYFSIIKVRKIAIFSFSYYRFLLDCFPCLFPFCFFIALTRHVLFCFLLFGFILELFLTIDFYMRWRGRQSLQPHNEPPPPLVLFPFLCVSYLALLSWRRAEQLCLLVGMWMNQASCSSRCRRHRPATIGVMASQNFQEPRSPYIISGKLHNCLSVINFALLVLLMASSGAL